MLLPENFIESETTECGAIIILFPNIEDLVCFYSEYRKVSTITIPDSYRHPSMEECVDRLGEEKAFCMLNANSEYWQIKVVQRDRDETVFTSHLGLYRLSRMPSGGMNAPATFQRAIYVINALV